jgi:DNA-binding HxlR family transcriptional regulator
MPLGQDYASQECSIARALEVVGERWTLLVVRDCFFGVRRFSDFQRRLGIPRAVLSSRLADLVEAEVLERVEERPGRPDYALTGRGRDLWPVVHALYSWGEEHATPLPGRRGFRHAVCDVELDTRGQCPTCGELPGPGGITMVPGPALRSGPTDDRASRALAAPHRLLEPLLP